MNITLENIVIEYLNKKIQQKKYDQNTINNLGIDLLSYFSDIRSPGGYYTKKIKPSLKGFGTFTEKVDVTFKSFLYTVGHIIVKKFKAQKNNLTKETIMSRMDKVYNWINDQVHQNFKINQSQINEMNKEIVENYYPKVPTLKI